MKHKNTLWKGTDGLKLEGPGGGKKKYKKTFTASGTSGSNL